MKRFDPLGEVIIAGGDLVFDLAHATHRAGTTHVLNPFPETRTEVDAVVEVLCRDKDVCVQ